MNCQSCGARIKEGEKFCRKCGKPVSGVETGMNKAKRSGQPGNYNGKLSVGNPHSHKKSKIDGRQIVLIVSGIVVVFAIAAVVLLFAFRNMQKNDDLLLGPENSQVESNEEEPINSMERNVILSEAPRPSQETEDTPALSVAPKDYKEQVIADFERACRIYDKWVRGRTGSTKTSISQEDPETGIQVKDGASFFKLLSEAFSTRYVKDCMDYMGVKRTDSLLMIPEAPESKSGSFLPDNAVIDVMQVTGVQCKVKVTVLDSDNKEWTFYLDGSKGGDHWVFDDLPTEVGVGQWGFFGSYNSPQNSSTPRPSKAPSSKPEPVITTPTPIPSPSTTPIPSSSPTPTPKPSPTSTPTPTPKPSQSPSPSVSPTVAPSPSPSVEPSPSQEPSPEPSPSEEPSPEPSPSEEPSPEPSPSEEPSPEPSPSPTPSADITHSSSPYTARNASGNEIGQIEIPSFDSESYGEDSHVTEVVDGMNAAIESFRDEILDRCSSDDELVSCTVETQIFEDEEYISVLLAGVYNYDSESKNVFDGIILDRNTGNAVSVTTLLSRSEEDIVGMIGGDWQAAVIHNGAVEFYLTDGTIATIQLP